MIFQSSQTNTSTYFKFFDFPKIGKVRDVTPLYESYSPDHSGTSRDVLDLIRDSEHKLIN
jgi:hypothetical protein